MKIYISGPITGIENFRENFDRAQLHLEVKFSPELILNPAANNKAFEKTMDYERFMEISMAQLEVCDTIYLLNGWQKSLGCRQEYGFALAKGMAIFTEMEV